MRHALLALSALALAGCHHVFTMADHVVIGSVHEERSIGDLTSVRIVTNVGDLRVSPSSDGRLHVEAEVRVHDDRALEAVEADFERDVVMLQEDGQLTIKNRHLDADDADDWYVSFTIELPDVESVELESGVGNMWLRHDGQLARCHAGVGNIDFRGGVETLELTSGVGDAQAAGDMRSATVACGTGNVRVEASGLLNGQLETGVGNVAFETTGSVGERLSCKTDTGDVRISLGADFDGSVEASTGVGSVSLAGCQGVSVSREMVSASAAGSLGSGSAQVSAKAGVGSVTVERRER